MTVRVHGDVDLATAPKLRAVLADCDRRGVCQLVVDLSDVDHMDSTGIGVLFGALRRARLLGGDLRVSATSAAVAALFELLSLSTVFVDRCPCNAGVDP